MTFRLQDHYRQHQLMGFTGDGGGAGGPSTVPIGTSTTVGGYKLGPGFSTDPDGRLQYSFTYTLPIASPSELGGIKPSANDFIMAADGTMTLKAQLAGSYTLPAASATTRGGITLNTAHFSISGSDQLNLVNPNGSGGTTAFATYTTAGIVQIDSVTLEVDSNGLLKIKPGATVPAGSSTVRGGYRINPAHFNITSGDVLNATGTASVADVESSPITITDFNTASGGRAEIQPFTSNTGGAYTANLHDLGLSHIINTTRYWQQGKSGDCSYAFNKIFAMAKEFYWLGRGETDYLGYHLMGNVKVVTPVDVLTVKNMIMVPGGITWECHAVMVRSPTGGMTNQPNSDNQESLGNTYVPCISFSPYASCEMLNVQCHVDGTNRGCGVLFGKMFHGKTYEMSTNGTGYTAGQILTLKVRGAKSVNSHESPYSLAQIKVETIGAGGSIATWSRQRGGDYDQTIAELLPQEHFSTGNGSGATFKCIAFTKDYGEKLENGVLVPDGLYKIVEGARAPFAQSFVNHCNVFEPGDDTSELTAGVTTFDGSDDKYNYHYGICIGTKNMEINQLYCIRGRIGILIRTTADIRINNVNTVLSGVGFKISGASSITCPQVVCDSSRWAAMEFSGGSGWQIGGRGFWENQNSNKSDQHGNLFQPHRSGYCISIGAGGSPGQINGGHDFKIQVTNGGGKRQSDNADGVICFIDRLASATVNIPCTYSEYSGVKDSNTKPVRALFEFGNNSNGGTRTLQSTNKFYGHINDLTGPVYLGDPIGNFMDIWDGHAQATCGPRGTYTKHDPSAPTAGALANKAGTGSKWYKTSGNAPHEYTNTGTRGSPTWN